MLDGENSGHIRLGLDASLDHAYGTVGYLHKFGDFGAFADAYAGRGQSGNVYGVTAGWEYRW